MTDDEAKAHVRAVTVASGTSFYWAMRLLPAARREAMFAIYAFCREVDDIADDAGSPEDKGRRLDLWCDEIDALYAGAPGKSHRARPGRAECAASDCAARTFSR